MRTKQQKFGESSENLAVWYLKQNGYKIIEQNYRTRLGEIDIIAREKNRLYLSKSNPANPSGMAAPNGR